METPREQTLPPSVLGVLKSLVVAARPKQWTKNLIIFFALIFTIDDAWRVGDTDKALSLVGQTGLAFLVFSMLSAAVYLVNDIFDLEADRAHPSKRLRPIASGQLPVQLAWSGAAALTLAGVTVSFLLVPEFGWVALAYLALMAVYSVLLKRIVLLDVFAISAGFVLRAVAGAAVLQVPISPWLYTCTGLGALLIALAKRRSELVASRGLAQRQRETLAVYTVPLLDQFIAIVATSTLLAYTLYTFTAPNLPENHAMMLTIPFVVYGLFRYLFLVHSENLGEAPEEVLITDIPLIVTIMLWLATASTVLVLFR